MKDVYQRCATFLRVQTRPNEGLVVIVSPRWFFMTVVTQPYCRAPNGNPCYLDGFDLAGLVSLQTTADSWPATAGLEDQSISILQAIHLTTKTTKIRDDEEEDEENMASIGNINNLSGLNSHNVTI